ncbi:15861_t:CDS:2 [Entrophospora sp. SA101]|nr:15861_t:CDS:2 [Entrophospora sp. SA101]
MSGIETDDIDVEDNNETNETGINNDGIWRRKNLLIYLSVNNNLILCLSKDNLDDNDLGSNGNSNEDKLSKENLLTGLNLLYLKTIHNFSNQAFNDISSKIIKKKISLFKAKKELDKLVPIKPKYYDMCINSCCLFYGKYNSDHACPICDEPRYINKKGRKHMPYLSLIERLKIQFNNKERVKDLLYRWEYTSTNSDNDDEIFGDVFDGNMYKELCEEGFFEDRRELALTVSCDGPNQPKDFNSFLQPFIEEMKILQDGIECYDALNDELFQLKAHILAWTGDIPAVTKVMCFTGHNSYQGCRFCKIEGKLLTSNRHIYYPLQNHSTSNLPLRGHEEILKNIDEINGCGSNNLKESLIKKYDENYLIGKKDWKEIGTILHNNKYNMPSNGRIPRDIYKHSAGYKAEEWSKWILHFSLPLIKGRIDERFLQGWNYFVKAAKLCIEPQLEGDEPNLIKENLENFYLSYIDTIFEESVEENRGWPSHRVYVNNNYEGYEFYSPSVKHSLNNSEANKLKECYDEYGLKYFEDYGSNKFIEIIGIDHCVGFLSFRPPNRKTEINCIIDDDDIDF